MRSISIPHPLGWGGRTQFDFILEGNLFGPPLFLFTFFSLLWHFHETHFSAFRFLEILQLFIGSLLFGFFISQAGINKSYLKYSLLKPSFWGSLYVHPQTVRKDLCFWSLQTAHSIEHVQPILWISLPLYLPLFSKTTSVLINFSLAGWKYFL